jgi:hypothetical protein
MSIQESQTFGKTRSMFEGYGGPVNVSHTNRDGIDPTLDACCQREIESNRKQTALESTLRRHDRVALAERRRRNLVPNLSFGDGCRCCYDTNDGGEYQALIDLRAETQGITNESEVDNAEGNNEDKARNDSYDDDDDSDDDSEFDYLLDEDLPGDDNVNSDFSLLQQERLEELKLSAMIHESAMQHGFGVHRQFHPQRVLYAAGLGLSGNSMRTGVAAIPPAAVIHLSINGILSASLDLCLEEMAANRYKGTKFVRSNGRSTLSFSADLAQQVLPKIKKDSSLPALIAVKDGAVVSVCENLSLFVVGGGKNEDKKVEPRAVEEWLDRAGVLLREVPIAFEDYCRIRPEEDALVENMMREKAKMAEAAAVREENIFKCGVAGCHKLFHHEHVGVKNEQQRGLLVKEETTIGAKI